MEWRLISNKTAINGAKTWSAKARRNEYGSMIEKNHGKRKCEATQSQGAENERLKFIL